MNELTENMHMAYEPTMAIIVYRKSHGNYDYYLESREIIDGQMGAGAPLQESTLQSITKALEAKKEKKLTLVGGMIPANLLFFEQSSSGNIRMAWFRKAEARPMHFAETLHIPDGVAKVPPMIYISNGGSLRVYALQSNFKPKSKTAVFQPPFHNCSSDGGVCLGSAKAQMPEVMTYEALMKYHEKLFWGSVFTHNGAAAAEGNLNLIWKTQIANPDQKFDLSVLKPTKKTLKDIL